MSATPPNAAAPPGAGETEPPGAGDRAVAGAGGVTRRPGAAPRTPGLRPALLVVGIAVFILVLFGIGSALHGQSNPNHAATGDVVPAGPSPVAGTSLRAVPAATALHPIRRSATPPTNIVDSLPLPAGAARVAVHPSRSVTLFDANEQFTVSGAQATVIDFYRKALPTTGWKVTSVGAARGHALATEVLAQKAGSDGWYWELGVVVSPTRFASGGTGSTGAGSGGASAGNPGGTGSGGASTGNPGGTTGSVPTGTTPFEMRLFQVNDAS